MSSVENWSAIRIPRPLHKRLCSFASRLESAHERGHGGIQPSDLTGRVALWQVIQRTLDEYEDHLERSGQ